MGVFTVAHDLHLHVAEVRQALVVGGFLPQPDVGGPGAGRGHSRQREREQAVGQRFDQQTSVPSPGPPALRTGSPPISEKRLRVVTVPSSLMRRLRPNKLS